MRKSSGLLLGSAALVALLAGCSNDGDGREARARLLSAQGHEIEGEVTFHETKDGVRVEVDIDHLDPGVHGIHIHQIGDCSAPDFSSAGEHFAPDNNPHGAPSAASHAGDFGNLRADDDGEVDMELLTSNQISLVPGAHDSIIGRAIVVHAEADDLMSQPSGGSGDRIACGVIELVDE